MNAHAPANNLHVAIATLGNRDVRCRVPPEQLFYAATPMDNEQVLLAQALGLAASVRGGATIQPGVRSIGAEIVRRLDDGRLGLDDLRYPIVRPFLRHANAVLPLTHVVLVATDQTYSAGIARQWEQDTCEVAEVMRRLVARDFPGVAVHTILLTYAPHRLGEAYPQVAAALDAFERKLGPGAHPRISVLTAGGASATTQAVSQRAVAVWGVSRCVALEAEPPRDSAALQAGRAESTIRAVDLLPVVRDIDRTIVREMLRSHSYAAALLVLEQAGGNGASTLERLTEHFAARLDLRFADALRAIEQEYAEEVEALRADIAPLVQLGVSREQSAAMLREMCYGAEIRLRRREVSDFVLRAGQVYELGLHLLCVGWSGDDGLLGFGPFEAGAARHALVRGYLEGMAGRVGRAAVYLERQHWYELTGQLAGGNPGRSRTLAAVNRLGPIWGLRNRVVHGSGGTSERDLVAVLGVADADALVALVRDVADTVLGALGMAGVGANPFDEAGELLEREIERFFAVS